MKLTRTVRFCVNDFATEAELDSPVVNSYAGWPSMHGFGRYYEFMVTCRGEPNEQTGYFINIKLIDEAVRGRVIPYASQVMRGGGETSRAGIGTFLREVILRLNSELDGMVSGVVLRLTPFYHIGMEVENMNQCILRKQFAFSASHRLHCPELSEEENRSIFGKCNNPNGHGHNYRIEVAAAVDVDDEVKSGQPFSARFIEEIVKETVVDRFDHKNLNADCAEFAKLNPSVENIARICYELLREPIRNTGVELREVCVWETEKTSCTYPG